MIQSIPGYNNGYFIGGVTHNIKEDAEILRKAMKGIGTDESAIIKVLANRSWAERECINKEFHSLYGKDLIKEIKSETSGNLEKALVAILTEPVQYDVEQLNSAMAGAGTNENTLIEILVTRSNTQKEFIKSVYSHKHSKSLKSHIESETSGDFEKFLVALLNPRDENPQVNPVLAAKDAEELYKAGEGKIGTDEKTFILILSSRSLPHIAAIAFEYEKIHKKHSLVKAIDSEFSGSTRVGLIAMVKFAQNPFHYLAGLINESMKGAGTNDNKLIRSIVTQMPFMPQIKDAYTHVFKNSLNHDISGDCSGDYKTLLLDIVN